MAMIDWRIEGWGLMTCNCNWGCPCQFNALPTNGDCKAASAAHIDMGHFGDVRLDGLNFAGLFAWPKAIHEGHGQVAPLVDERATTEQRAAILAIMAGEHTDPGATIFNVLAATLETVHAPKSCRIDIDIDIDKRRGRLTIDGVADASVEPIRNPVTGAEHRARVVIPEGFEFTEAEFASGTLRTRDGTPIVLEWDGSHAHLCRIATTGRGLIRG